LLALVILLITGLIGIGNKVLRQPAPDPRPSEKLAATTLSLQLERRGANLIVSWNRNAATILHARIGALRIRDGIAAQQELRLDAEQLRNASVVYTPVSNNVEFWMALSGAGGQTLNESVLGSISFPFARDRIGAANPRRFRRLIHMRSAPTPINPLRIDLTETYQFLDLLAALGITLVCISAGSPYYNPHIQRPALFPPSDGYEPPEDPLAGAARLIAVTSEIKRRYLHMTIVGTGYSYLQEWLPHVAQHYVRTGQVDFVGLGRLVLSYHDLPMDVLRGMPLQTKRLCRTFSDCTTGPRNGLVSGCFPLDPFYRTHPQAELLRVAKAKPKS
jgi:hypothetical protein